MGSFPHRFDTRPLERPPRQTRYDRLVCQTLIGCNRTDEDVSAGAAGAVQPEITRDRTADITGQRQARPACPLLRANSDLTVIPIDVLQLQRDHLAGTKSKPSE